MGRLARFIRFYTEEDDGNGGEKGVLKTVTGALLHIVDALAKPAKKFVATLSPVQDLHGQDAPYPAGGGKNLLPMTVDNLKLVNTSGTWSGNIYTLNSATFTLNTDNGGNVESITVGGTASARSVFLLWSDYEYVTDLGLDGRYYISGCPSGGSGSTYSLTLQAYGSGNISDTGSGVAFNTSDLSNQKYRMIIDVKSGSPTSTLVFKPLFCLDSVSDKSYAPYSNICPITGWTGANVYRTGVNVWDEETTRGNVNSSTGVVTKSPNASSLITDNYISIKPETEYIVVTNALSTNVRTRFYDENKNYIGYVDYSGSAVQYNRKFKTPSKSRFLLIEFPAEYGTTYNNDISINYPATDTDYHAYIGQTIHITFPALGKNLFPTPTVSIGKPNNRTANIYFDNVLSSGTYTLSYTRTGTYSGDSFGIEFFNSENANVGRVNLNTGRISLSGDAVRAYFYMPSASYDNNETLIFSSVQLESGSSASSYEPYTTTAYGGTLTNLGTDVWKLRVDKYLANLGSVGWNKDTNRVGVFYSNKFQDRESTTPVVACTDYEVKNISVSTQYDMYISGYESYGGNSIFIRDTRFADYTSTQVLSALNGVMAVLYLATPIEYTITETQALTLLKGENNIWVNDSDDLELQYYAKAEETP